MVRWALREGEVHASKPLASVDSMSSNSIPNVRIGILKAMNGRVLEVSTYKPNPHGPDWSSEMFIVPEGQNLSEALTMLLALKGLNT